MRRLTDEQRAELERLRSDRKCSDPKRYVGAGTRYQMALDNYADILLSAHDDAVRYKNMLDQVARSSTHPDRDGPGCWWCIAGDGEPHEPDCAYAALTPTPKEQA